MDSPSRYDPGMTAIPPGREVHGGLVSISPRQLPVEVVEPPLRSRVHRPADVARLVGALVLLLGSLALGDLAVGTAGALEQDLALATGGLPRLLVEALSWAGGAGVVALPILMALDLWRRGRLRVLVEALVAASVGVALVDLLQALIVQDELHAVIQVLTRPLTGSGRTPPFVDIVVAAVAMVTAGSVGNRPVIGRVAWLATGSLVVTHFVSGSATAFALYASVLLGWIVGLAFRLVLGVVSSRPSGIEIAKALNRHGILLRRLERLPDTASGTRRYAGISVVAHVAAPDSGEAPDSGYAWPPVMVEVFDRDTFGGSSARRLFRLVRLRGPSTRSPALSVRRELEHRALMGLALRQAGVAAPELIASCEVNVDAGVLVWSASQGRSLGDLASPPDDLTLGRIWRLRGQLLQAAIAHRGLTPEAVMVCPDATIALAWAGQGDIAAADLALRLDTAQLLLTLALLTGAQRAVSSAVAELGELPVFDALPLLQPALMDRALRARLRRERSVVRETREAIAALRPSQTPVDPVELRRLTPRTALAVAGGTLGAYLLLSQLAKVDIAGLLGHARWGWAAGCFLCAALTFAGASLALTGAAPLRLRFLRTYLAQLAAAFSGLVAPSAVGHVAVNTRYLQKSGLAPATAAASVGLAQVAQFCSYAVLLVVSSVAAGIGPKASFSPPAAVVVGLAVFFAGVAALLALPRFRSMVAQRFLPSLRQALPRVLSVFRTPARVAQMFGGALLLDLSFVAAITCATRAFGATTPVTVVAVVYFAGALIGSAVPTPGGLGGVEAALSAGLVAVGTDSAVAVSAVLLYRLATFWTPIPLGWVALTRLQRIDAM